ncbi:MAG: asparagine synthase-related protein [Nitrospirota bacterium]
MPGISVIYDPSGEGAGHESLMVRMCALLQRSGREGPVECYSGPGFSIGRCRPALINRSPQPSWNEKKTICAFFHGELLDGHRHRSMLERRGHHLSDADHAALVVHLYEEAGEDFIHGLNGRFSLVLWDSLRERLIIANDRYGLHPLYTASHNGIYRWASSTKAILADEQFPRKVNLAALADFLCLNVPQSDDTLFYGIHEVPPASIISCEQGTVSCRQYWDMKFQEEETRIPAEEYLHELIALCRRSAERRQSGQGRFGFLLSGGMDSRLILSVLNREAVKTFTFGTPLSADVRYARKVARVARVPHRALEIKPDYLKTFALTGIERTEDLINCNQFHGISVYDEIALHVDTLATGSVGEDIFGHFNKDPESAFWGRGFTVDRYYDMKCITTDEELGQLLAPPYSKVLQQVARARFHKDFGKYQSAHVTHRVDYWGMRQQQRRVFTRLSSLFPDNLVYCPFFFDNDLIDFVQKIPPSLRWGERSLYRRMLTRTAPDLAALPATTTNGLPLTATHRQMSRHEKMMHLRRGIAHMTRGLLPCAYQSFYVDYDAWLRKDLREWAETVVFDPLTMSRGYWNPAAVRKLWDDHQRGYGPLRLMAAKLTSIVSFELWCRLYLDGRS